MTYPENPPDQYQFLTPSRPAEREPPDESRAGEEIDIDEEDERIFDQVWAELAAEEIGRKAGE
jgi:hypothetical protein